MVIFNTRKVKSLHIFTLHAVNLIFVEYRLQQFVLWNTQMQVCITTSHGHSRDPTPTYSARRRQATKWFFGGKNLQYGESHNCSSSTRRRGRQTSTNGNCQWLDCNVTTSHCCYCILLNTYNIEQWACDNWAYYMFSGQLRLGNTAWSNSEDGRHWGVWRDDKWPAAGHVWWRIVATRGNSHCVTLYTLNGNNLHIWKYFVFLLKCSLLAAM